MPIIVSVRINGVEPYHGHTQEQPKGHYCKNRFSVFLRKETCALRSTNILGQRLDFYDTN